MSIARHISAPVLSTSNSNNNNQNIAPGQGHKSRSPTTGGTPGNGMYGAKKGLPENGKTFKGEAVGVVAERSPLADLLYLRCEYFILHFSKRSLACDEERGY